MDPLFTRFSVDEFSEIGATPGGQDFDEFFSLPTLAAGKYFWDITVVR